MIRSRWLIANPSFLFTHHNKPAADLQAAHKEEQMKTKNFWGRLCPKLPHYYVRTMAALMMCAALAVPAFATNAAGQDMWTVAQNIIVDVYNHKSTYSGRPYVRRGGHRRKAVQQPA